MRNRFFFSALVISLFTFPLTAATSQAAEAATAPTRLLQFSAGLNRVQIPGLAGVTFAVYRDQEGGAPLWSETRSVDVDENGKFSVVLGAIEKIPMEIFSSGEARWLGVQRLPASISSPRAPSVSTRTAAVRPDSMIDELAARLARLEAARQ